MQTQTTLHSASETEQLAWRMGKNLRGGEVIELVSDLGGGKTTFVRGLAKGFGSKDKVSSPTFTVSKVYRSGNKELHHFDFYRLSDAGIIGYELHDLVGHPDIVVVTEWGEAVQHILPDERLSLQILRIGDEDREFTFTYPASLTYLMEDVC